MLGKLAELDIIEKSQANAVADAYLEFRKRQHAIKLQGHDKVHVPLAEIVKQVEAVKALWAVVLD